MKDEINEILKGRSGKTVGAAVGFIIGILIVNIKIFFLLICVCIGYFIGRYFDEKGKDEISLGKESERTKK